VRDPGSQCNNLLVFLKQSPSFSISARSLELRSSGSFQRFLFVSDDVVLDIVNLFFIFIQVPVPDVPCQFCTDIPQGVKSFESMFSPAFHTRPGEGIELWVPACIHHVFHHAGLRLHDIVQLQSGRLSSNTVEPIETRGRTNFELSGIGRSHSESTGNSSPVGTGTQLTAGRSSSALPAGHRIRGEHSAMVTAD